MRGIGGSRSVGFGMQQIRSLPDAVARALEQHMETLESNQEASKPANTGDTKNGNGFKNGHDTPSQPSA